MTMMALNMVNPAPQAVIAKGSQIGVVVVISEAMWYTSGTTEADSNDMRSSLFLLRSFPRNRHGDTIVVSTPGILHRRPSRSFHRTKPPFLLTLKPGTNPTLFINSIALNKPFPPPPPVPKKKTPPLPLSQHRNTGRTKPIKGRSKRIQSREEKTPHRSRASCSSSRQDLRVVTSRRSNETTTTPRQEPLPPPRPYPLRPLHLSAPPPPLFDVLFHFSQKSFTKSDMCPLLKCFNITRVSIMFVYIFIYHVYYFHLAIFQI